MRDFFYNKGDVLIAVLIVLIAAFVIYWRVGVIMDYSADGKAGDGLLPNPFAFGDSSGDSDESGAVPDGSSGAADGASAQTQDETQDEPVQETPVVQQPEETTPPPEQTPDTTDQTQEPPQSTPEPESVSVTVAAGDSWSTAADKLVAAKLITDKTAFLNKVVELKADSKLQQRTFTIPAGSTPEQIINIMIK